MRERTIIVRRGSFGSFMMGAILGAGLALLFAPKSGEETRSLLSEKGNEIKDKGYEFKDKATEVAKDTKEKAQSTIDNARSKIEETTQEMKQSAQDAKNSMNDQANADQKELKRNLEIMEDVNNPNFPL